MGGPEEWLGIVFWLVIFGMAALGIWSSRERERERQQTLRLAIEKGQALTPELLKQLARPEGGNPEDQPRNLLTGGIVVASVGFGLMVLAQFIGHSQPIRPLVGVGGLMAFLGAGLLVASYVQFRLLRKQRDGQDPQVGQDP